MRRRLPTLPTVRDGFLHEQAVEGTSHNVIPVGSAQWFLWVEQHRSFRSETTSGAFTVRKEQRSGGWYWYAYRRRQGKVQTAYLGKSAELTLQRLNVVTTHLARGDSTPAQPVSEDDSSQDHPASLIPQLARLEQVAHELTLSQQTEGQQEETVHAPGPPTSSSGGGISRTTAGGGTAPGTAQQPPAPLLLTKVQAPRLRSALVDRFRLTQRLQEGLEGPLTLLSAPAGFGKTTLLTSWLASSGTPAAWFSVEPEDNDPVRFFTYLIAALQRLDSSLGTRVLPLLQSRGPVPIPLDTVLALLINELSTHEEVYLVLVLDDYHVITTQSIHRAIAYLVEHLPPQMHLVIAARADPPLPLAQWRARGQLSELGAAGLRFDQEEANQFLRTIMGVDLSIQESTLLHNRTEGWIAGLQLAALALQRSADICAFLSAFTGSHRFILDYLSEEVLARQPAMIQSFLLSTSILDRLSEPLCDAVTRQKGSQRTLQALERANLFVISLDDEQRWYRYHHLFAEMLRSRLQQTQPTLLSELHRRASEWYEQQGLIVEAIQHALAAHDVEHTADLLEQWGIVMFHHGQFHLLLGWLNALPQALVDTRPHLCLLQAHLLLFLQEWEKARTYLDQIGESLQADSTSREAQAIQGKVAVLRGGIALSTGDLAGCMALAHEALALLPQTEETWHLSAIVRTGLFYLVDGNVSPDAQHRIERLVASLPPSSVFPLTGNILLLARLYMMQGKLHQALATLEQTVQKVPEQAYLWRWIGGPAYIGKLLREWNDLDAAERQLREVLDHLLWADIITEGYITLARIQWACGKYQQARVTLESFEQLARQRQFVPHLFALGAAIRAEIALVQGDLAAAVSWANDCTLSANDELSYLREREYLTLVRVRIAQGRSDPQGSILQDALHLLDRLLRDAEAKARMHSAIEILVLKALALHTRGDLPAALGMLKQALTLAQPEGYVRIFLDEGAPMLTLLSQVGKVDPSLREYVQMVLVHAKVPPAPPTPLPLDTERSRQQPLVDPLSERELEVLRILSTGASNEQIAEHLVIALGTVKRHISNILAKLGVSNRTQAVAQARAFDLL